MTAKTLLTATLLALSPMAAMAACSWGKMEAASCADGNVWDPASETCVPVTSS